MNVRLHQSADGEWRICRAKTVNSCRLSTNGRSTVHINVSSLKAGRQLNELEHEAETNKSVALNDAVYNLKHGAPALSKTDMEDLCKPTDGRTQAIKKTTDASNTMIASNNHDGTDDATSSKTASAARLSVYHSLSSTITPESSWVDPARADAAAWSGIVKHDMDGNVIDWDEIKSLPLHDGVGAAAQAGVSIGSLDGVKARKMLDSDYALRRKLEATYESMASRFMKDEDKKVSSFRLARAISYADKRLQDEIDLLSQRCDALNVDHPDGKSIDDEINSERRAKRKAWREEQEAREARSSLPKTDYKRLQAEALSNDPVEQDRIYSQLSAWNRDYLPGDQVDEVFGIDIETTGLNAARDQVLDIGYEYMHVSPTCKHKIPVDSSNEMWDGDYELKGAYGIGRQMFGVADGREKAGIETEWLTGIGVDTVKGKVPFDEDPAAQSTLLEKLETAPFVAHNASYEHKHFMANVAGYAEAYRDGKITIIDTMPVSKLWDTKTDTSVRGANRLESWARRWGAIGQEDEERHLGGHDAHIMLDALREELEDLHENHRGPWDDKLPIHGIGGANNKH